MNRLKILFNNIDYTALKIMKAGLKVCFWVMFLSILILSVFLHTHSIFLFNFGLSIFKLSTYLSVEFIVCGLMADKIKKQI